MIKSMRLMMTIDHFNLRSFDLNLLIAFDAMMQELNVTRAAKRLKIQQPAMSHNIATLRTLFDDELFVRIGHEMHPTARARSLAAPIRQALDQAQAALMSRQVFRPEEAERTFRIAFSNELELLLVPELTALLREKAPGIRILARSASPDQVERMLDDRAIELAVGCPGRCAAHHVSETLFQTNVLSCFHPQFLPLKAPLDRAPYLAAQHAVVSETDELQGCLKNALDRIGVTLDVVVAAPDFLTVLAAAARSPVIATISASVARRYAPLFGLAISEVPLPLDFHPVSMAWPVLNDQEPGLVWLRSQLRTLAGKAEELCWPKAAWSVILTSYS